MLFVGNVVVKLVELSKLFLFLGLLFVIDGLQNQVFESCEFVQLLADFLEVRIDKLPRRL